MTEASRRSRLFITFAIMAATIMQVLDTTIVNVALPHMQGELGATTDEMGWVLTSYMVASAIFMPLAGFFTDTLGRKKYLMISISGFVLSSTLCGLSSNLTQIVLFRLLQGVFGAALVPLSQAIMVDTYPLEERGSAMAIWAMGVMAGPILGPSLGGYLTDTLSWRWTFFINIPVGILSIILASRYVPDTPRIKRTLNWVGLVYLSMAIAGLQFVLDRGNEDGWFGAHSIQVATFIGIIGFIGFLWHSLRPNARPLFHLTMFSDRNFTMSCIVAAALGLGMYGAMVIQPILLETLLGYPIITTGLVMAPRGIASALSMLLVGKLVNRLDARLLVSLGILLSAVGSWAATRYYLGISTWWLVWPVILQGFGIGMIYVPLSTMAFATLPANLSSEAAGMYSLVRTVGSSIGISVVTTIYSRLSQVNWNQLGGFAQPFNPAAHDYLFPLNLGVQTREGVAILGEEILRQSQMIALIDVFGFITVSFIIMLPLVLLLRATALKSRAVSETVME